MEPRPYQTEAREALDNYLATSEGNPCIVIPTGGGKTPLMAWTIKDYLTSWPETRILVLAHVKELLAQGVDKMRTIWPAAPIGLSFKEDPLQSMDHQAAALRAMMSTIHSANRRWWIDLKNPCACQGSQDCPECHGLGYLRADRNVGEMLMLVVSEVAEAMEGHRKNKMDDKLPDRPMVEVELADAMIRILDLAAGLGLDLPGAYVEKMAYNASREDHKIENRLKDGGKKY